MIAGIRTVTQKYRANPDTVLEKGEKVFVLKGGGPYWRVIRDKDGDDLSDWKSRELRGMSK